MHKRTLARTVATLAMAAAATCASAQVANVTKRDLDPTDPTASQMWADVIKSVQGMPMAYVPLVQVITTKDRFGRSLAYSIFQSGPTCGAANCQGRLFIDGKLVNDGIGCAEFANVNFSIDGTYVDDCGARINIPPPAQ